MIRWEEIPSSRGWREFKKRFSPLLKGGRVVYDNTTRNKGKRIYLFPNYITLAVWEDGYGDFIRSLPKGQLLPLIEGDLK